MKVQATVMVETIKMAIGCLLLSAAMVLIYASVGKFDAAVLYGALVGTLIAVLNFFALGLFLQKAVEKSDSVKLMVHASYSARMIVIFVVMAVCLYLGFCNPITLLLPLIFPRLIIFATAMIRRRHTAGGGSVE